MDGGAGVDWVVYHRAESGVTVYLDGTVSTGGEAEGDIITNVERAEGSLFGDTLVGNSGLNYLRGRDGDDTLIGGEGDDYLQGDAGADTLEGGNGLDMAYYASSTMGVTVDLGNTTNNTGEAIGDVYLSIEGVFGSKFDDNITGDSGDNYLRGFLGDDIINGGEGNDTLRGEAGADTFVFDFGNGNDVVIDYNDAEDMLDLTDFGFGSVSAIMNFASDVSGDVVFDFGAGGTFTIEDTTSMEIMDNIIV
jgi:Ca2+-binding RTX toxin-like protein